MKTYKVTIDKNRTERWYNDQDQLHCEHGPAVIYANGDKSWYINGKYHNENGPAIEYTNGDKSWYINNIKYTESEWKVKLNLIELTQHDPIKELTLAEVINKLGYNIKLIK